MNKKTMNKKKLGSKTAKGGFANEKFICEKFNNWKTDKEAQSWLQIMGYNINEIKDLEAIHIPLIIKKQDYQKFGINQDLYKDYIKYKKADIQIKLFIIFHDIIKTENLSLKKANSDADFNQIDKRTVDSYQNMWNFDDEISFWLKLYTGEKNPACYKNLFKNIKLKDKRRIFFTEMPEKIVKKIISFFEANKILIISDILKGRGGLSTDWILVTKKDVNNMTYSWILKDINTSMNFFGQGNIYISKRGNLHIGRITMQRKGGTPDPTKLQFKIYPCDLFLLEGKNGNK